MKPTFVTETVEEQVPLWLFCREGVIRVALMETLKAAGFAVVEPEGEKPFAVLVVQGGAEKQEVNLPEGVLVYWIKFDSGAGVGPPGSVELMYEQVFAGVKPPLSLLDELTRRLMFESSLQIRGGECAPLLLEDVCEHVAQTLLAGRKQSGIFSGEKKIAYSEFISRLRQELKLPKGKTLKQVRVPLIQRGSIPSRDISSVIAQTARFYETLAPTSGSEVKSTAPRKLKTPLRRRVGSALLATSFVVGLVFAGGYTWYQLTARQVASQVRVLAYEPGKKDVAEETKKAVSRLDFISGIKDFLLAWAHQGKASDLRLSLPLLGAALDGAQEMREARGAMLSAYRAFVGQDKNDAMSLLREADAKLDTAYKNFSLVQARFVQQEVNLPQIMGGKGVQEQLTAALPQLRKDILAQRSMVGALLLMLEGKHSYALVLLDDSQLRGSGGTVVAVAVITLDSGKLLTNQVYPVSVINQMLTGEVQAPDEVRAYLRQNSWTLPDATWDMPFSKTAERLSWFLGRGLSRSIDGVITLPASGVARILEATGTLSLGNGEELTPGGFNTKREELIAQLSKEPQALENWYSRLLSAVVEKMLHSDDKTLEKTAGVWEKQFSGSEAFVSVPNQEAQRLFAALSWEGGVSRPACPPSFISANCRVSGALVLENNLAGNHINPFIQRSHVHATRIGSDAVLHNRVLTLTNTSSLLAWPYGSYQTLVKFAVPDDAQVQSLSINDTNLNPTQFSMIKADESLMVRVGVEVAPGATVRIRLLYTEPGIPTENSSLVFFEQKQPGAGEDSFTLILTYPDVYTPKSVAPRAEVGRSSLTFTSKHDSNRLFAVGF